jgi:MFS family permease
LAVAGVATLGLIMAALDTTIVNVALDTLSRELHSPLSSIQWVSTGYLLSLAAVIPLSVGLPSGSAPNARGSPRSPCSQLAQDCARWRPRPAS